MSLGRDIGRIVMAYVLDEVGGSWVLPLVIRKVMHLWVASASKRMLSPFSHVRFPPSSSSSLALCRLLLQEIMRKY
jgi:hypothetical protein